MQEQKGLIYSMVVITGLALLWVVNFSSGPDIPQPQPSAPEVADGKTPPPLSDFPMHRAFIDEATCLRCHQDGKEFTFNGETLVATKIAHEVREDCISCHRLPQ